MVGDDVESDVGGAKALGMRGVLVRTGKFEEKTLAVADPQPDAVIDSIADLPALLSRQAASQSSLSSSTPADGVMVCTLHAAQPPPPQLP